MKKILNSLFVWLRGKQYLIYFSIGMFIMDFYVRVMNRKIPGISVLNIIPYLFTLMWLLIFCVIIYLNKKKGKIIFTLIVSSLFIVLMFTQLIYVRIFSKFFMSKDLLYIKEGLHFIDSILNYFRIEDFIVLLLIVSFMIFSIYTQKYISEESKKEKNITVSIVIFLIVCLFMGNQMIIGKANDATEWSAFSNKRNMYNQFNDEKRMVMLCGLYEYTFRDFYLTFLKPKKVVNAEDIKLINDYINSNNKTISEFNGIFKDKNLIMVMLEDIDTWMIKKDVMPTLYNLKENSLDFTNHFSINYSSGFTFNTEFIVNTGIIPKLTMFKAPYAFNQNNYDYSLPSLFKNAEYKVNSIHRNVGSFYNRDNMHLAWGYENHFDYSLLEANGDIDLDTTTVSSNLDKFIYAEKFMTFYITFSAHMPFVYSKSECQANLDYIKTQYNNADEEYLCSLSQAKVTDDAIKILIDELEKQNKMDDTVLVFLPIIMLIR